MLFMQMLEMVTFYDFHEHVESVKDRLNMSSSTALIFLWTVVKILLDI